MKAGKGDVAGDVVRLADELGRPLEAWQAEVVYQMMYRDRVRILVDGKLAFTTAQAARRLGVDPATLRREIKRLGIEPVDHLDARTPLYAAAELDRRMR